MALYEIDPSKSYSTKGRAITAANKLIADKGQDLKYITFKYTGPEEAHDGRWVVVFIGMSAIEAGVHFYFNCIA